MSIEYFMDKMLEYEIDGILDLLGYADKVSWEQSRFISYLIALVNSTKRLKPTDIMKFSWDELTTGDTAISNADVERLRKKALELIKQNNNGIE